MVGQARARDTKAQLLQAAVAIFADKGFSGARVEEIARRAKANKAMIYYHFGTKEGLYKAVLLATFSAVEAELEAIVQSEADPLARLMSLYRGLGRMFRRESRMPQIILREMLAGGSHMHPDAARMLARVFDKVRRTLEDGRRQGQLRAVHPLLVHLNLVGTLLLFGVSGGFRDRVAEMVELGLEQPAPEAVEEYLQEVLARTLVASPAGSRKRS